MGYYFHEIVLEVEMCYNFLNRNNYVLQKLRK